MDSLETPPPSPAFISRKNDDSNSLNNNFQGTTRPRSQSSFESPVHVRRSTIIRKESEKTIIQKKNFLLIQTEDQLLIPQYIYMPAEKFKGLSEYKQEEAKRAILKILSEEESFKRFLETSGWLAKLAVHPFVALKALSETYYDALYQKDQRYPDLLIRKTMENRESFEKLLFMHHISFSRLLGNLKEDDISRKTHYLEEIIDQHKRCIEDSKDKVPLLNPIYWKSLGLLYEINPDIGSSIKTDARGNIEGFLKEDFVIPQNFWLFFYGLPRYEKSWFSSLYRYTGEYLLYSYPTKAIQLIKISSQTGDSEAHLTLGLYHQHMGNYEEAIKHFTAVNCTSHIFCNLGAAYESLNKKEKAIECYQGLEPKRLTGKYRLLRLYESRGEKEKTRVTLTSISDTLASLLVNATSCFNPIEAAAVSVLLGKPEVAKKFISFFRSGIDNTNFSPHKGELHLLSAFVKHAIKQHDPESTFIKSEASHLTEIKEWAASVLERTGRGSLGKLSPFTHFSLMTGCIGSYSLPYLVQTPLEQILADFDKHIPQLTQENKLE